MKQKITIFTPTYNREYILHKCYESLCRQTCKDFIWLIIDDGSTDNTRHLIEEWQRDNSDFEIRYIYKPNGGMHTAHNTAYRNIDTQLNVCIDSDDYMTDDAVEKILDFWQKNGSPEYAGIIALDIDSKEYKVIGKELPAAKDTTLMGYYSNGGSGDKKLIYRTDIINSVPEYPEFKGEKYVGLAYKYHLVDEKYKLLIMNEPVCVVDYQSNGSSATMWKQYYKNPKGFAFFRNAEMKYQKGLPLLKTCIHYTASSILSKNKRFLKDSTKKAHTILALPIGIILACVTILKGKD